MQLKMVPSRQGGRQERPGAASRRFSLQEVDKKWCPATKETAKKAGRSAQKPPGVTQEPPRSLPNRPPDQARDLLGHSGTCLSEGALATANPPKKHPRTRKQGGGVYFIGLEIA